jgi:hypothetical protein
MQRLLSVNKVALNDLAKRGIVVRGKKHGSYAVASVTRYCEHFQRACSCRGCRSVKPRLLIASSPCRTPRARLQREAS